MGLMELKIRQVLAAILALLIKPATNQTKPLKGLRTHQAMVQHLQIKILAMQQEILKIRILLKQTRLQLLHHPKL